MVCLANADRLSVGVDAGTIRDALTDKTTAFAHRVSRHLGDEEPERVTVEILGDSAIS